MKFKIICGFAFIFMFTYHYTFAQGCSDAGFCTLNSFKPDQSDSATQMKNQLKIGAFYGLADYSISVYGSYLEYNRIINDRLALDFKLTSLGQNGNGFSAFGLSDIFLNASYKATDELKLTLGAKVPLSKANHNSQGLSLPMDYQASLGTYDLILGVGYQIQNFQIVTAWQQPLTQNDNQFLASNFPNGSKLREFQSSNKFQRSGDILLRLSYPININSNLKFTPSILPIYHLANDKYTDESNQTQTIIGSKGITLNGNAYFDYDFNNRNAIQLNVGMPMVVRNSRPDGLTRSIIVNLEFKFKF